MTISKEEREMIDAFIKKNGVTCCPPCTYTPYHEIRHHDRNRNVKLDTKLAERNKMIDRLHSEGLTQSAIAIALSINPATVSARVQWITYKASQPKQSG